MAIRIGFATWSLGDLSLKEYLPDLVDAGYDGVEIVGDLTRQPADDLRDVVEDHGLSVLSVIPTNEIDLAHPLRSLRQESVDAVRGLIDYSVAVGARRLVLREKPGRMRPIVGRQKEWTVLQQSLRSLVGHAAGMNVHLALLPVNRYEGFLVNTVRDANALLQTISDPGLDLELALSTYHMHLEESDLTEALQMGSGRLGLLYAAENNRRAVGQGQIDWIEVCQALGRIGFDGTVIVECQADGADPFLPVGRSPDWESFVIECARRSIDHLRVAMASMQH